MVARASAYQQRVADAVRRLAEAQAKAAREEEARRTQAALEAKRADHVFNHAGKADEARARAEAAEAEAERPAKEITRTVTPSGLTAGAREEWTFEIDVYDEIPLAALRPYFKRDAVEAAIRLAVKQGVRELQGVTIKKGLKATFR
jgi:Tfp pilus assembly protein FimV